MKKKSPTDNARSLIHADRLIADLNKTLVVLKSGYAPRYIPPSTSTRAKDLVGGKVRLHVNDWTPLNNLDLKRLGLQVKTIVSVLGKVLPDLRSLEMNDITEGPAKLSDLELAQRLSSIMAESSLPGQSPLSPDPSTSSSSPGMGEGAPGPDLRSEREKEFDRQVEATYSTPPASTPPASSSSSSSSTPDWLN